MSSPSITLLTVFTPANRLAFSWNLELAKQLNSGVSVQWLAVEQPSVHLSKRLHRNVIRKLGVAANDLPLNKIRAQWLTETAPLPDFPGLEVIAGPSETEVQDLLNSEKGQSPTPETLRACDNFQGSYAQFLGLVKALPKVAGRHLIILDPDFFVLRPNWLIELKSHIETQGLTFFGAPWNPRHFHKWTDFPAPHFLWIDRQRVNLEAELFRPNLIAEPKLPSLFWEGFLERFAHQSRQHRLKYLWRNRAAARAEDKAQREQIGSAKDVGHRLRALAFAGDHSTELVVPFVDPARDHFRPNAVSGIQRAWDRFEPPHRRYEKERRAGVRFSELGLIDVNGRGWEEWFWRGRPFGLHQQGNYHRESHGTTGSGSLHLCLNSLATHWGWQPIAPEWTPEAQLDQ